MSVKRPFDTHIILWIDLKNILAEYKEKKQGKSKEKAKKNDNQPATVSILYLQNYIHVTS